MPGNSTFMYFIKCMFEIKIASTYILNLENGLVTFRRFFFLFVKGALLHLANLNTISVQTWMLVRSNLNKQTGPLLYHVVVLNNKISNLD